MTTPDAPIRRVAIVGGGIVGWSAAAALRRRVPGLAVAIVATPPAADALADRMTHTLPSTIGFHDDLGLREEDAVLRAGGGWRLGTLFDDWAGDLPSYVHTYGPCGQPFGTASFHHHWVRAARAGTAAPFDAHAPAAALARAGRMPVPSAAIFAGTQPALVLDVARYRAMLEAFARHLGVEVIDGAIATVRLRAADGFVERLSLADGRTVEADLFVDASGPSAVVRGAIDGEREDWSRWFRCDRLMTAEGAAEPLSPLDRVTALPVGWRWRSAAAGRTLHGLCYAGDLLSDDEACRELAVAGGTAASAAISFRQGTRRAPWARNCVAIGDAATVIEPLDFTNLHLAQSAIDRIVSMLPGRSCHPLEVADYNRQAQAEVERVRDFVLCHYATARRAGPFWQPPDGLPDGLSRTLALFAERGRLPFFEEETFARDDWLAVLLGQGVLPRRVDPLIDTTAAGDSDRAMAAYRAAIVQAVLQCPKMDDYHNLQRERLIQ
ncbi:tryptophan halogenase family protein [Sphingomonas phyllosphaerae]|uniref:tryptophan halogenase family protein n=1 Tax=Sphingomonas phyllosphaerae TaxID=257003 RepID=UPI000420EC3C|nr:tryptophan halogenase family protein [Sphingomonas phyllosphaerae]